MQQKKGKKKKGKNKLRHKYKLVLMDAHSYEEKFSFSLSRLNVIGFTGTLAIVLIVGTIYLIAFTSLREYIPGYTDVSLARKVYELQQKADSLESEFHRNQLFIANLKRIIGGEEMDQEIEPVTESILYNIDTIELTHSREDSLLRAEYENQNRFSLYQNRTYNYVSGTLGNVNIFPPLQGIITRNFDPEQGHFGIDIVASHNEAIRAALDGTVIFSDWTLETGYTIGLQHHNNLITVYKHNSSLLKQQGTFVKAGETISIVGESGELTTGPHLHFELWYNGNPIDPEEFISF
ncbi:MAG: M23 family metallopeptidase [Bacteroidales bacterium]